MSGTFQSPAPRGPTGLAADGISPDSATTQSPISVAQWEWFVGSLRHPDDDADGTAVSRDHADAMLLQLDDLVERLEPLGEHTRAAVRGLRRLQASIAAAGGRTVPRGRRPEPPDQESRLMF